jgi:hypothetical protein
MPRYSRYSRKHKRGGRPPNTSTYNGQRVEYAERDNLNRENNIAEPAARPRELEIGQVDPRSVGLNEEQLNEYHRQLEEGNMLAYQARQMREGTQGWPVQPTAPDISEMVTNRQVGGKRKHTKRTRHVNKYLRKGRRTLRRRKSKKALKRKN